MGGSNKGGVGPKWDKVGGPGGRRKKLPRSQRLYWNREVDGVKEKVDLEMRLKYWTR